MRILLYIMNMMYDAWKRIAPFIQGALCIMGAALAIWAIVTAVKQLKKREYIAPSIVMIIGGLILAAAIVLNIKGMILDFIYAFFGCTVICVAAIWNGVKSKRFRFYHPILRIFLSLLVMIGFAFL